MLTLVGPYATLSVRTKLIPGRPVVVSRSTLRRWRSALSPYRGRPVRLDDIRAYDDEEQVIRTVDMTVHPDHEGGYTDVYVW